MVEGPQTAPSQKRPANPLVQLLFLSPHDTAAAVSPHTSAAAITVQVVLHTPHTTTTVSTHTPQPQPDTLHIAAFTPEHPPSTPPSKHPAY